MLKPKRYYSVTLFRFPNAKQEDSLSSRTSRGRSPSSHFCRYSWNMRAKKTHRRKSEKHKGKLTDHHSHKQRITRMPPKKAQTNIDKYDSQKNTRKHTSNTATQDSWQHLMIIWLHKRRRCIFFLFLFVRKMTKGHIIFKVPGVLPWVMGGASIVVDIFVCCVFDNCVQAQPTPWETVWKHGFETWCQNLCTNIFLSLMSRI